MTATGSPRVHRWAAAALLVGVGWLATPNAVPIYDGISMPDEPYRYSSPPAGYRSTPHATTATASSPVAKGLNTIGMSIQTAEQGPQASLFIPQYALAAPGGPIVVKVMPLAPTDQPAGATIDGNVYDLSVLSAAGPVTLTPSAAVATIYLRATTAVQPGPVMEYRADVTQPWTQQNTSQGGQDVYVSSFKGAGQYALAFVKNKARASGGQSPLPIVLISGFGVLAGVVVFVRVRAERE